MGVESLRRGGQRHSQCHGGNKGGVSACSRDLTLTELYFGQEVENLPL